MTDKIEVHAPFDDALLDELELAGEEQIESLLATAHELHRQSAKRLPKHKRIAILERAAALLQERKEEFVLCAAAEGGKPYVDSSVEVDRAIQGIKLGAQSLLGLAGEEIPMGLTPPSEGRIAFTTREPIGPVVSISAFNHPVNLIVHQTVPAIASGCPVIIKPASTTPLSCFKLIDLFYDAGLPREWCRAVLCDRTLAERLATDPRVKFVSFIGSAEVGWSLRSKLAAGTHCALEHGGAAPVIVEESADIGAMLPLIAKGGFYHAGQVCVSVQRVFVDEGFAGEVASGIAQLARSMTVGDPRDPKTEVGPLIIPKEVTRVEEWVEEAKKKGAEILCGGERISDSCYEPTVVLNPPDDIAVSQKEVFGPVVCVYSTKSRKEAIERANNVPFSFQASIFTKDIDGACEAIQDLNAKAVMINDHTAFRVDWMPFGGKEHSGIGVGGIPYSMKEMTSEKLVVIKSPVLV